MEKPLGKKRPKQHRINKTGMKIFEDALPELDEFAMHFNKEDGDSDYGIDGEIQVFKDELHTGEFIKVQLKSKSEGRYIENSKILSIPIDLDSIAFMIDQIKDSVVLIVIDNSSRKVYWHPIQTCPKTREAFNKRVDDLRKKNKKSLGEKTISIHVDTNNILSPDNYSEFYSYIKELRVKLSQKSLLAIKNERSLRQGIETFHELESEMFSIKGFDWSIRSDDTIPPRVMFSINESNRRTIDYFPNAQFQQEFAPTVKLRTKFSTKSAKDRARFESFQNYLKTREGSVSLDGENIDKVEAFCGDIPLFNDTEGTTSISLSPSVGVKNQQSITLSNGLEELEHKVWIWMENNVINLSSVEGQNLILSMKISLDNKTNKFTIRINHERLKSVLQEFRLLDYIKNTKNLLISIIDEDGFKKKLLETEELPVSQMFSEDWYKIIRYLKEIEEKSGARIPYPLPEQISKEECKNIKWIHHLMIEGEVVTEVTTNFCLQEKPKEQIVMGKSLWFTQRPPEIYLFGLPYVLQNFEQTVSGVIDEIEINSDKCFKIKLKNARVSISKKE